MESSPGFPVPSRPVNPRQNGEGPRDLIGKDRPTRGREGAGRDFGQVWNKAVGPDSPSPDKPGTSETKPGDVPALQPMDSDLDPASAGLPIPQMVPESLLRPIPLPPVTTDATSSASDADGETTEGSSSASVLFRPVAVTLSRTPFSTSTPVGSDNLALQKEASQVPAPSLPPLGSPGQVPPQPSLAGTSSEPGRIAATPPEGVSDPAGKVPIELKAAEIAASTVVGTAGRNPSAPGVSNKNNFLTIDEQPVTEPDAADGIPDALGGIRMRRPQETPNPSIALSNGRSRLTDGLPGLAEGRGAARPNLNFSPNREMGKIEGLPLIDRPGFGGPSADSSATTPVTATISTPSIPGSRQADAVAVLESIHRLAEQAVAQGQNRLSMSLRLEDGGRIRIRLVRDGGNIHTLLNTDVPGLEAAFRQQWSQFSQDAGERGFRFQTLSFAEPDSSPGENSSSQEQGQETTAFDRESTSAASPLRAGSVSNGKSRQSAGMNPVPVAMSGAGHLRAWV